VLHRLAARRVAFVRRACGIGSDERDARRLDDELLGRDLDQRRLDPLAELRLAGEHRDRAVRIDANPRIEQRIVLEASR